MDCEKKEGIRVWKVCGSDVLWSKMKKNDGFPVEKEWATGDERGESGRLEEGKRE